MVYIHNHKESGTKVNTHHNTSLAIIDVTPRHYNQNWSCMSPVITGLSANAFSSFQRLYSFLYNMFLTLLTACHMSRLQGHNSLHSLLATPLLDPGGGDLSTKVYPGTCRWNGSQNQPPGITMTPYSVQKLV